MILSLGISSSLHSEQRQNSLNPQYETITVTASRRSYHPTNLAGNLTAIDAQSLADTSHIHINEIASQSPGVWISRGNGQEHLSAIRSPVLTGAGSCSAFLMAADGIPLRSAGFCNVNELFEANTEQARQIEVIRGPGGTYYGSNALHGVINVINQPRYVEPISSVGLELGPYDYGRIKAKTEQGDSDNGWFIEANYANDGGYKDSSGYKQGKMNAGNRVTTDNLLIDNMFALTSLDQQTAGFITGYEAYKDKDKKQDNPNPDAYRKSHSLRWYTRIQNADESDVQWQVTPFLRHTEMEFLQHFLPWQSIEENGHSSIGVQSSMTKTFSEIFEASIGLDLEYTNGYLKEYQPDPFSPTIPQGEHYDYQVEATTVAPFAALQYTPNESWQLNAGLRYDNTMYRYENDLSDGSACAPEVTNCRFYRPEDSRDRFNNWSPKFSTLYRPKDNQQLYLSISRGFRAPHTSELYRLQNGQQYADIDSVRLDSLELGWRGQFSKVDLEFVLFTMEKSNIIFQDTQRNNVDGGETSHEGFEASLQSRLTDTLVFNVNASYAVHKYSNDINIGTENLNGNDVDTAPRWLASAQLDWRINSAISSQLEWVHVDKYFVDPQNRHTYEGHDLFHLQAQWQINDGWRAQARISNLTDEDYAERADFGFGSYRYFVGQPRGLYVSIIADL